MLYIQILWNFDLKVIYVTKMRSEIPLNLLLYMSVWAYLL